MRNRGEREKEYSEADWKLSEPSEELLQDTEINTGPTDCAYKLLLSSWSKTFSLRKNKRDTTFQTFINTFV